MKREELNDRFWKDEAWGGIHGIIKAWWLISFATLTNGICEDDIELDEASKAIRAKVNWTESKAKEMASEYMEASDT